MKKKKTRKKQNMEMRFIVEEFKGKKKDILLEEYATQDEAEVALNRWLYWGHNAFLCNMNPEDEE